MPNEVTWGANAQVSAQPFLKRSTENVWARCDEIRDAIHTAMTEACHGLGVDALVHKSLDFEFPAWALVKAWIPVKENATQRIFLRIDIRPQPYHTYEYLYDIVYTHGEKTRTVTGAYQMGAVDVGAWVRYVFGKGGKPRVEKLRSSSWDFWRPRNQLEDIGADPWKITANVLIGIGAVFFLFGRGLGALGLTLLFVIGGIVFRIRLSRRKRLVVNTGKPVGEPRRRMLADSWNTVLVGLGSSAEEVRHRLDAALGEGAIPNLRRRLEKVTNIGVDAKQERDQFVLMLGRGILFCHVDPFGDDLYVAWDAYINYGEWGESEVRRGFSRKLGMPMAVNTVVPTLYTVTEYDLIDLNCLIEWTHARITRLVKRMVEERRIDQEIDFKIQRGERQGLLGKHDEQEAKKPRLFRRN